MFKTLDVGCGDNPHGEVNIDHRMHENIELDQVNKRYVDIESIPNFIRADALNLPFRDNCFEKTFCFHVIEHVSNPYKLISELIRVTRKEIEIRCPHRFSKHAKRPYHIYYFTKSWFVSALKGHKIRIELSYWYPLRGFLGLIRLPHEIRVDVKLKLNSY